MLNRKFIEKSAILLKLEAKLNPKVKVHFGELKTTGHTDTLSRVITLDGTQTPLKLALTYAYELKNLENAFRYQTLIYQARNNQISKVQYVKEILLIEAEAVLFRNLVFFSLHEPREIFPCNKKYLELHEKIIHLSEEEALAQLAFYIQEQGIVKNEYSAKKYYADQYDYHSKGKKLSILYTVKKPPSPPIIGETVTESKKINFKL